MSMTPAAMGATIEGYINAAMRSNTAARAMGHYLGRPALPLLTRPGEPSDALVVSPAKSIVDKGVSALFGREVLCNVPDNEAADVYLSEVWRRNKRPILLQQWATNAAIAGTGYLRIIDQSPFPRLINLDPLTVDVLVNDSDYTDAWRFTITPPPQDQSPSDPRPRHRTVISNASGDAGYLVPQGQDQWTITDQQLAGGDWQTVQQEQWPYPFCPIVWVQNLPQPNSFFGTPDLSEEICHVCEALNRVASLWAKTIRIFASPKVWARGLGPRTIDMSSDSVLYLPSETAELRVLELQHDAPLVRELYDRLLEMLAMMARVPLVALGVPDNQGALSGVSLQLRWQPLIDKTEAKRLTYGDALTELDRRLLSMAGFGDNLMSELTWPDPLPADPIAEAQTLVLHESLGVVSKETIAEKLGYSWDDEQQKLAEEKAQAVQDAQAAMPASNGAVPPPAPLGAPIPEISQRAPGY